MPRFLHSIICQEQALSADGIYTFDLTVNPTSVLLLALRPLNDTGTLANFQSYMGVVGALDRVTVARAGESIISASGRDLAALNWWRRGVCGFQSNHASVNNDRRCAVLPLFFGKHPYSPSSIMPPCRRGELTLELSVDIADTGYDGLRLSVESIEVLDAKPKEFERSNVVSGTAAATGQMDIDLNPTVDCRGVLVFGTTGFAGATPAPTIGRLSTLVNNVQVGFAATDFEVSQSLPYLFGRGGFPYDAHKHIVTTDGNAQSELSTLGGPVGVGDGGMSNYTFLDFDPTHDDAFTLRLAGASRFSIRAESEVAEAWRALAVEVVGT